MSIGITREHAELAESLRKWAAGLGSPDAIRAAEGDRSARFDDSWTAALAMGLPGIAVPEVDGGGGGSVLDAAVALEAAAHELVPGPLLGTSIASALLARAGCGRAAGAVLGDGAAVGLGLEPELSLDDGVLAGRVAVVWDAPSADRLLLGAGHRWFLVPAARVTVIPAAGLDLSRRFGSVVVDGVRTDEVTELAGLDQRDVHRMAVTLAAAEAAGIARWCLAAALEHAKVREQFGQKIGSFQAVKHLCAQMLESAEAVTAVAWDAASAAADVGEQWAFAADTAGVIAFDGAVRVAQDCIQVLGGIGFTFEHDAHLHLRRALTLRNLVGDSDLFAERLAASAAGGVRRSVRVDLSAAPPDFRATVHANAVRIADLPAEQQRDALVDTGYLAPHWPAPHGLGAGPVEQLVVDEELAAAGVVRPDLKVGRWAVPTLLGHGTDEQCARFVEPTLRGAVVWCQLFSEPEAGSDLASLRTRAVRDGNGWRLTGQKVWTSLAREAQWAICLARTNPEAPQHKGITYFLVEMSSPGIDIRPLREITGDALFNEVFLDDVFVPDDCLVGEVDGGWRLAVGTLAHERVAMAGTKLDLSVERAVALAHGADVAGRVRIGRAVALATVCSLLGLRASLRSLEGRGPGAESSVAKLLTVRNRQDASELVLTLLGPRVVLGGAEVEEAVHEALLTRCLSIAGGTTQVLRNVVAERILGLPR